MQAVGFPILQNDLHSVIYNIPSGKLVMIDGEEKRVKSESSNGSCFYVALERIFLANTTTTTTVEANQHIKVLISMLRDIGIDQYSILLDKLEDSLSNLETEPHKRLFHPHLLKNYKECDKKSADILLSIHQEIESPSAMQKLQAIELSRDLFEKIFPRIELTSFVNSGFNTFYEFLHEQYFSAKFKIYQNFMNEICTQKALDEVSKIGGDDKTKVSKLQTLIQALTATKYGFKTSGWNGSKTIDDLLTEMKSNGPMLIPGKFGKNYYQSSPVFHATLSGKQVLRWGKDTKRTDASRSHIVILMGVSKKAGSDENGGGHVYFLDPNDPSDPASSQNDRIYVISYKNLKTNLEQFEMMGGSAIYPSGFIS